MKKNLHELAMEEGHSKYVFRFESQPDFLDWITLIKRRQGNEKLQITNLTVVDEIGYPPIITIYTKLSQREIELLSSPKDSGSLIKRWISPTLSEEQRKNWWKKI